MYCENKNIIVGGMKYDDSRKISMVNFKCIITNDSTGQTLSIGDGHTQYTIQFEPLEKWLK